MFIRVLDVDRWQEEPVSYDLISCLNVLDRCDRPLSILRQLHRRLREGGVLILAVVFPFKPFVEKGVGNGVDDTPLFLSPILPPHINQSTHTCTHTGASQAPPTEQLPVRSGRWEEGVGDLVTEVLQPLGFSLLSISTLPYLCEGDLHNEWFALQDVILVLSKNHSIQ